MRAGDPYSGPSLGSGQCAFARLMISIRPRVGSGCLTGAASNGGARSTSLRDCRAFVSRRPAPPIGTSGPTADACHGNERQPFVRLPVIDIFLYQALVDALAPAIEGALARRKNGGGTRCLMSARRHRRLLHTGGHRRARVLAPSTRCARECRPRPRRVVADVTLPLGIRGLPQGIPASSALGNFFISPLDQKLHEAGLDYLRYMDDA
jgi:hypothetical protein